MPHRMNRRKMIEMLHELDRELKSSLDVEICGASCAILNHGLQRASTDIDVMRSSIPFDARELNAAIHTVAVRNDAGELWINDKSREVFKYIPQDYEPNTDPIRGEKFKLLKPMVISRADFVITKLAHHERIRQHDISDIKALWLEENDVRSIYRKLDAIAGDRQYDALIIEGNFKAIRSDLVKNDSGHSYSSGKEIAKYSFQRYGMEPSEDDVSMWQESLDNLSTKAGAIIARIDLNAGESLKQRTGRISGFDSSYRTSREEGSDHASDS